MADPRPCPTGFTAHPNDEIRLVSAYNGAELKTGGPCISPFSNITVKADHLHNKN
jgi:hypothetical protein